MTPYEQKLAIEGKRVSNIFPSRRYVAKDNSTTELNKAQSRNIVKGILDVINVPSRVLAALITSQKMSDPNAYAARPLVDKLDIQNPVGRFATEFAGQLVSDPITLAVSAPAKISAKLATTIGKNIMESAIPRISKHSMKPSSLVDIIVNKKLYSPSGSNKMKDFTQDAIDIIEARKQGLINDTYDKAMRLYKSQISTYSKKVDKYIADNPKLLRGYLDNSPKVHADIYRFIGMPPVKPNINKVIPEVLLLEKEINKLSRVNSALSRSSNDTKLASTLLKIGEYENFLKNSSIPTNLFEGTIVKSGLNTINNTRKERGE